MEKLNKVYLVGAGPGDPELITQKGLRALTLADYVLYDRLIPAALLDATRPDAVKIFVGKKAGDRPNSQTEINEKIMECSRMGTVARLKGGDPLTFARGGEEIAFMRKHSIPFEIIPGVTAASALAAALSISLTHRDLSSELVLVTGQSKDPLDAGRFKDFNLEQKTLVLYMGLSNIEAICLELGRLKSNRFIPAAVLENISTDRQRVFRGRLEEMPEIVKKEKVISPALFIFGRVVQL